MIWRIRSRKVFRQLRVSGERVRSGPVRMTFVPLETAHPQVALAVGRKFGPAVERNRARRRLRHAFAAAWDTVAGPAATVDAGSGTEHGTAGGPSGAFLLTANRSVLTMPYPDLVRSVRQCLVRLASPGDERR